MDDQINEKIKSILSDPDSLKSILSIASALGAGNKVSDAKEPAVGSDEHIESNEENGRQKAENVLSALTSAQTQGLPAIPALGTKTQYADNRVNLLLSIKPFLSERKRQRVDSLVKALGAAKIISSYKELDILSKFL